MRGVSKSGSSVSTQMAKRDACFGGFVVIAQSLVQEILDSHFFLPIPWASNQCTSAKRSVPSSKRTLAMPFSFLFSLFTILFSLFTFHFSLFTIHYSLFTIHYSLL